MKIAKLFFRILWKKMHQGRWVFLHLSQLALTGALVVLVCNVHTDPKNNPQLITPDSCDDYSVELASADFGRIAFRGPRCLIYEAPGSNGRIKVTAKIVGSYQNESDFKAAIAEAMAKVKEMYSGRYSLSRENQRVFSSGELKSPGGNSLNDCKEYIITPKGSGRKTNNHRI